MGFALFLLIFGGIVLLIGGIVAIVNIKNLKRRSRILNTPTSPIAQAPGNGPVEIQGRILASEHGVVMAPFSGRHCVWVRITVQELRRRGRSSTWVTVINESDGRPFFVDDGSGGYARVSPMGAHIILDKHKIASSGTFNDASPHLEAFLQSRGIQSTSFFGFNKQMRYEEEVLSPNDPLYAIGPSRRDPGPPVGDGYRNAPSTELVMFAAGGNEHGELILTNKTEQELVSKLLWGFVGGCIAAGVGFVMVVGGGLVMLVS